MSLLKKIGNFFKVKENETLTNVLSQLLRPKSQQEYEKASKQFENLILRFPDEIFTLLRSKQQLQNVKPKAENLLNLLLVLHQNIENEEIADQLRQTPIYWIQNLMDENRESFRIIERMLTEPSTSSFFPSVSDVKYNLNLQQIRIDLRQKKGQDRIKQVIRRSCCRDLSLTNISFKYQTQNILKLSINIPLYMAIKKGVFPYDEQPDEVKIRFIWIYKLQNNMQNGLRLLECKNEKLKLFQMQVRQDLMHFQKFIQQQIDLLIDQYATMNSLDTLSLYEIYQEFIKASRIIDGFHRSEECEMKLDSSNKMLDEFLSFSIKLKVLNQFQFKKSIKVPTKDNPHLGPSKIPNRERASSLDKENYEPLTLQDLQSDKAFERGVAEKKFYNLPTEQSFEEGNTQSQRPMHIKGLSTFHH
ncbi:hypothetical protein pb186bvf_004865 [Paramecium bursaria]